MDNSGIQLCEEILLDQTQVISMNVSGFRGNCHLNSTYYDDEIHCTYSDGVWSVSCQSASQARLMMVPEVMI